MMTNQELVNRLKSLGYMNLYHANSVSTWCTFLSQGSLLSRHYVDEEGLWQTYQASDKTDVEKGVDDDVFLDIMDLHMAFNRKNQYGPVLGVFSVDMLANPSFHIAITQDNPIYWDDTPEYYSSFEDYILQLQKSKENRDYYNIAKMMLTIRSPQKCVTLDYLDFLILDNPHYQIELNGSKFDLFQTAKETLISANSKQSIEIKARECSPECECIENYHNNLEKTAFMFMDEISIKHGFHKLH